MNRRRFFFDPTQEYLQVIRMCSNKQQTIQDCLEADMKRFVPFAYRQRVRYTTGGLGRLGEHVGSWVYRP